MTTLMITGAGGFLGSHVLEAALSQTDWDVLAVDSFRHNGDTDRISNALSCVDFPGQFGRSRRSILDDTLKRVHVVTHDLVAPFTPHQLESFGEIDYVVHAAARCSVDDSITDPRGHVENNVQSTLTMLELARHQPALAGYVHVSTDEVFGAGTREHAPSSPYAASKAACEDVTRAYRHTFKLPIAVVNSANLFGPRQSQLAFIPATIRKVLYGETVNIHTRDGLIGSRWYTYAPNVAAFLVQQLASIVHGGHYYLRGQEEWNILDLAHAIALHLEMPLKFDTVPADVVRPGWDITYAPMADNLHWAPTIPFDRGLSDTCAWFAAHLEWLVG